MDQFPSTSSDQIESHVVLRVYLVQADTVAWNAGYLSQTGSELTSGAQLACDGSEDQFPSTSFDQFVSHVVLSVYQVQADTVADTVAWNDGLPGTCRKQEVSSPAEINWRVMGQWINSRQQALINSNHMLV